MTIGPTEIIIIIILCSFVVIIAASALVIIHFFRRLKGIDNHLRSVDEKMKGTSHDSKIE